MHAYIVHGRGWAPRGPGVPGLSFPLHVWAWTRIGCGMLARAARERVQPWMPQSISGPHHAHPDETNLAFTPAAAGTAALSSVSGGCHTQNQRHCLSAGHDSSPAKLQAGRVLACACALRATLKCQTLERQSRPVLG